MTDSNDDTDFSRRTFMRATGAVAGAGLVGAGANAVTAGTEGDADRAFLEYTNPRVRRAAHAWERGYRGRADRSLALTDTGADARHPDVGPWNGVTVTTPGSFKLIDAVESSRTELDGEGVAFSGTVGPGLPEGGQQAEHEFEAPDAAEFVEAELAWQPQEMDLEFYLDAVLESGDRKRISEQATANNPEVIATELPAELTVETEDGETTSAVTSFVFVVDTWANVTSDYEIEGTFFELDRVYLDPEDVALPAAGEVPQLVGWHNDNAGYGDFDSPRDENSHGTHVSGIMTGTGRASAIDADRSRIEEPRAVLLPGDTLTYEVEAPADTGVFGSAYGDAIEITIEAPTGEQLRRSRGASGTSEESFVNNTAETPTVHDDGDATYRVHVRAIEGEALPARVDTVAVGAFEHFSETGADATGESLSLHGGVAPGYSLVAVTDLSSGTADLAEYAEEFVETFGLRAVNMSWGFLGGLPLGTVAGIGDDTVADIRALADAGILTVAAAGNDGSPATGNGPPGVANEAVSTVATGPLDGIASYSSGGLGGVDDETHEPYAKPDVTAIGGVIPDLDQSAIPGDPEQDDPAQDAELFGTERNYSGKGGTSMASPSACGTAGLVAQAMEEDAPDAICLPEPAETGRADVLRLKQALLATASTTAFNAAPYHRGKAPTYTHAERDPYEGFGRVNAGAAVDAVSRDLLADGELDGYETVGLDVPDDEQAVAGYVHAAGEVDVAVEFSHYGGGNAGMTKGDPHVDLLVYDAENPLGGEDGDGARTGDPNVVASDQGVDGAASVAFDAGDDGGVYYVVAKLVSVPGVVNGYDVQAHLELSIDVTEPPQPAFTASGDREVDSSVSLGRDVSRVELTVTDLDADADVVDRFPEEWTYLGRFSDGEQTDEGEVSFGTVSAADVEDDDQVTFTYFVESPDTLEESRPYTFGPAEATVVDESADEFRDDSTEFAGEDDVLTVGVDV